VLLDEPTANLDTETAADVLGGKLRIELAEHAPAG